MKMEASDPDVATIVARIQSGDLDLQPDFQRGEVWPPAKKQRLIDSILRDWHVPPIHVIEVEETAKEEVLDGQQRLASIRDFVEGEIRVDGLTEPRDSAIEKLDNLSYDTLPDAVKRRFNKFSIRFFRITDYAPDEPGELFFRLNQPTRLTVAEQRNAFYGPVRQQVKWLVERLEEVGVDRSFIGFSNSRMSYDEVVARLCVALEEKTLSVRVTSPKLTEWYRSSKAFSNETIERCTRGVSHFGAARHFADCRIKLNKATFFSWLWFFVEHAQTPGPHSLADSLGGFLCYFEKLKYRLKGKSEPFDVKLFGKCSLSGKLAEQIMYLYIDRSSSRVTDVTSVQIRDAAIWIMFAAYLGEKARDYDYQQFNVISQVFSKSLPSSSLDSTAWLFNDLIIGTNWGHIK